MSFKFGGPAQGQQALVPPPPPPPNPATFADAGVQAAGESERKRKLGFGQTLATAPGGVAAGPTAGKQLMGQ